MRIQYERGFLALMDHQDEIPVMVLKEHVEGMHQLDVMLARSIGRMRFWGDDVAEQTKQGLLILHNMLEDARSGKPWAEPIIVLKGDTNGEKT